MFEGVDSIVFVYAGAGPGNHLMALIVFTASLIKRMKRSGVMHAQNACFNNSSERVDLSLYLFDSNAFNPLLKALDELNVQVEWMSEQTNNTKVIDDDTSRCSDGFRNACFSLNECWTWRARVYFTAEGEILSSGNENDSLISVCIHAYHRYFTDDDCVRLRNQYPSMSELKGKSQKNMQKVHARLFVSDIRTADWTKMR